MQVIYLSFFLSIYFFFSAKAPFPIHPSIQFHSHLHKSEGKTISTERLITPNKLERETPSSSPFEINPYQQTQGPTHNKNGKNIKPSPDR